MFTHLANAAIQQMIVDQDPWYFFWVIGNTLWVKQEVFINSIIGILGWLDTPLPTVLYVVFVLICGLIVASIAKKVSKPISFPLLLTITGISFITILAIMYHFYIYGTAVAYPVIDSLQGRYLIPFFPFLLFILIHWYIYALRHKAITLSICFISFIAIITSTLFYRYYDYSRVFDTGEKLLLQEKALQNGGEFPTKILSTKETYFYDVKYPQYKIGGFQLLVNVDVRQPVNVPYKYEIMDAECAHVLRKGYFDQTELHRPHLYTQLFAITPLNENKVCLVLTPLYGSQDMNFLPLVFENEKPLVNFLYIKK